MPEQFQQALGLMQQLDQDKAIADIEATHPRRPRAAARGRQGRRVGYCLGGRLAFMSATRTDVDASVGYYGVGLEGLLGEKHAIARPLLLHIAGADHFVTPDKQTLIHEGLDDHPKVDDPRLSGRGSRLRRRNGQQARAKRPRRLADSRTEAFFAAHVG